MESPNPFVFTEEELRKQQTKRFVMLHWWALLWGGSMSTAILLGAKYVNHDAFYRSPIRIVTTIVFWIIAAYLVELWRLHRWVQRRRREQLEESMYLDKMRESNSNNLQRG